MNTVCFLPLHSLVRSLAFPTKSPQVFFSLSLTLYTMVAVRLLRTILTHYFSYLGLFQGPHCAAGSWIAMVQKT